MKTCTKCGEKKPLDEFARDNRVKSGRAAWCKSCRRVYAAGWSQRRQKDPYKGVLCCRACGLTKLWLDFNWDASKSSYVTRCCRSCRKIEDRRRHNADPTIRQNMQRRIKYGLSSEEFDTLLADQDNACAACSRSFSLDLLPVVDHDHADEHVRGILCGPCNRGLGQLGDDPDRVLGVWLYILRDRIKVEGVI